MKALMSLLVLTLVGCAPSEEKEIQFSDQNYAFVNTAVPQVQKRLIFLHGIDGSHRDIITVPGYKALVDSLMNSGWQVIAFDLPKSRPTTFDDGGESYRAKYASKLKQAIQWADTNVGVAHVNVIGGISFGGLHALMGAAIEPAINGYFADVPMTKVEAFSSRWTHSPAFSPFYQIQRLSSIPGHFDYGDRDQVVGYQHTIELASLIGPSAIIRNNPGMGHSEHDLTHVAQWILSRF